MCSRHLARAQPSDVLHVHWLIATPAVVNTVQVVDGYEPLEDGRNDNAFISKARGRLPLLLLHVPGSRCGMLAGSACKS